MRAAPPPVPPAAALAVLAAILAACGGPPPPPSPAAPPAPARAAAPAATGPALLPDGGCSAPVPPTATTIAPGINECEIVRLKGRAPDDVLIGESGRGSREVQVLYAEPGSRELYFFVDGRLDRVVK